MSYIWNHNTTNIEIQMIVATDYHDKASETSQLSTDS